jgi:hypothetical protein
MLSVCDIQGEWREENTKNVWVVNGIIAERKKVPRAQKKPIALSDGPAGVEWGNGNLKGNIEDGLLVWRNRRGESTYRWTKMEDPSHLTERMPPAVRIPAIASGRQLPTKTNFQKMESQSPRSTNSGASNETAEMLAGMMSLQMAASNADEHPTAIAVAEMKMLMEMAANRLLAGDVYTSMKYITLANQVQPMNASSDHMKQ